MIRRFKKDKTSAKNNAGDVQQKESLQNYKSYLDYSKACVEKRLESPRQASPTSTLDNYFIKTTLGTGTFGRVVLLQSKQKFDEYYAMKIMKKFEIIKMKQTSHVLDEKKVLEVTDFPFIVRLAHHLKDNSNLYLIMEFVGGGDMHYHLRRFRTFDENLCRFYASQIVLAFEYLHHLNIVYRDLKPENILLDAQGYLKLTDFGFAKWLTNGRTYTLCGTPDYLAPEIILAKGYGKGVDWWTVGVLLFEMASGYPPFWAEEPFKVYEKAVSGVVKYPMRFSPELKDILRNLLHVDLTRRLGNMKNGAEDVKNHKFFQGLDWMGIFHKTIPAPYVPTIQSKGDVKNFMRFEDEAIVVTAEEMYPEQFRQF